MPMVRPNDEGREVPQLWKTERRIELGKRTRAGYNENDT
jgi:hypothetical protein